MPAPPESLSACLPKLLAGDDKTFDLAFQQFFERICLVVKQQFQNNKFRHADEEDIALSVFNALHQAIQNKKYEQLEDTRQLFNLLKTIAKNKAIGLLRAEESLKRGAGRLRGDSVFAKPDELVGNGWDMVQGAEPAPDYIAALNDSWQNALGQLTADLQRIALLKIQGYENLEIAQELGISLSTVERRVAILKTKLQYWNQAQTSL
jgi:RNA polymerase sigma factor (sigma-70 family)